MSCNWVASIFVHHPNIILFGLAVFSGSCLIIPLASKMFPNFADPQMGFETRGTDLSNKITTWQNLVESTKTSGPFSVNPKEFLYIRNFTSLQRPKKRKHNNILKNQGIVHNRVFIPEKNNYSTRWLTLEKFIDRNIVLPNEDLFCGPPDEKYAQLILKSDKDEDLFNAQSLFKICRIEMELAQANHFKELCVMTVHKPKSCCRPWTLNNYIAALNDRTSCLAITEDDINSTKVLLKKCAKYYHNLQLKPDCSKNEHCTVPKECVRHDAVYNIMNFLTDTSFLPSNDDTQLELKETVIFLPIACSTATLPYYYDLGNKHLKYEGISVVAMEFGIKSTLFDETLLMDAWLMLMGGVFVLICMWLYTKSLFLTIMTIIAIVFSLGISYFLYTLVFDLGFFPFMNLLAAIVAIGIGADDAFIFCKVWYSVKQENEDCSLVKVMNHTLHHALISMFVTSVTTAVAFLTTYLSSITALRCFGVFAGTAVIANYILMISWLPAAIVFWEKHNFTHCTFIKSCMLVCLERWCSPQWKITISRIRTSCAMLDRLWQMPEICIIDAVIKFKFFFFLVFTITAIISSIIVFYYPKLQLPNSNEFQLFVDSHPFEQYELVYKNKFWYKRQQSSNDDNFNYKLPLRFVWGLLPVDNGDYMNPQDIGELELDHTFSMSDPESQKWLLSFCKDLRKQPFYQPTLGPLLPNCFIESFVSWMDRRCVDPFNDSISRAPCCESSKFPYDSSIFEMCVLDVTSDLYETPAEYFMPGMAGPKFSKDDYPVIQAVVVEYDSNYTFSMSYEYMNNFLNQVDSWMTHKLESAPSTMKGGWFISDLEFYDLQRVLSNGTFHAIMISMVLALIVLFLTTLNVLTSAFAIFTITCSIISTMAILVLMGWKLNILESVAISSTIGLTVDFSLHYTVSYRMCPNNAIENRELATRYALSSMLGPTTMVALTTAAAGCFMMPSDILAYKQIGQFLVIVMIVSWMFAVFHLGPLLAIAGPERHYGQYYYSKLCRFARDNNHLQETRPTASSSTDSHEMESLNHRSICREKKLQRSVSNKSHANRFIFSDQSPSATSAITIIMADDN